MKPEQEQAIAAEYLAGMSRMGLCEKYGISRGLVGCILRRQNAYLSPELRRERMVTGAQERNRMGKSDPLRPVPSDFAQIAHTMPKYMLAAHYKTGDKVINRWLAETGTEAKLGWTAKRPVPDDFAEMAACLSKTALIEHYRTNDRSIRRWLTETGLTAKKYVPTPPPKPAKARAVKQHQAWNVRQVNDAPWGPLDEAKRILQHQGFNTHRCNERGGFDLKGKFWRVGWSVLDDAGLLERAEKYRSKAA